MRVALARWAGGGEVTAWRGAPAEWGAAGRKRGAFSGSPPFSWVPGLGTVRRALGVPSMFRGELAGRPGTPGTSGHLLAPAERP